MGQKQKKDKTESATGPGRRTRADIEKWDQTDSPDIPDMGETTEIPNLPSGGCKRLKMQNTLIDLEHDLLLTLDFTILFGDVCTMCCIVNTPTASINARLHTMLIR